MGSGLGDVSAKLQTVVMDLQKYDQLLIDSRRRLLELDACVQAALDGSASGRQRQVTAHLETAHANVRSASASVQAAKRAAVDYMAGTGAQTSGAAADSNPAGPEGLSTAVAPAATHGPDSEAELEHEELAPEPATAPETEPKSDPSDNASLMERIFQRLDTIEKNLGLLTKEDTQNLIRGRDYAKQFKNNPTKPLHPASWPPMANDAVRGFILSNLHTHESMHKLQVHFCTSELEKMQNGTSSLSAQDLAAHQEKVPGWLAEFKQLLGTPGQPLPTGSMDRLMALSAEVQQVFPDKRQKVSIADLVLQADPGMAAIYIGKLLTMAVSTGLALAGAPIAAASFKYGAGSLSRAATAAYQHSHSELARGAPPPLRSLIYRPFFKQAAMQGGVAVLPFVGPAALAVFEWTVQSVLSRERTLIIS